MEKIDRLGWAAGFSLDAYGVTIGVRVTDARVVPRLRAVVPYGAKPSRRRRVDYLYSIVVGSLDGAARPRRLHLAYSDLAKLVRTFDFDKVVEALEHDMPLVMGARTRQWVFLHAGVVGGAAGRCFCPGAALPASRRWWRRWCGPGPSTTPTSMPYSICKGGSTPSPGRWRCGRRESGRGDRCRWKCWAGEWGQVHWRWRRWWPPTTGPGRAPAGGGCRRGRGCWP